VLTALSFIARGLLLATRPQALNARFWRVAPHVNDTLLLAAGVGMAVVGGFNPLTTPWLATKLVLLLAYIGLGTLALKRGKTPQQRAIAFVLANIGQQQHQLGGQPGRGQRVESTDHRHAHPGRQQQGVVDMRGHTPEARIQRLWPGGQQQATGNKRQRGQHRAGEMQMFQGR
jgi:uncharacterized membrane protein SirB2